MSKKTASRQHRHPTPRRLRSLMAPQASAIHDPAERRAAVLVGVSVGYDPRGRLRVLRDDTALDRDERLELARALATEARRLAEEAGALQ